MPITEVPGGGGKAAASSASPPDRRMTAPTVPTDGHSWGAEKLIRLDIPTSKGFLLWFWVATSDGCHGSMRMRRSAYSPLIYGSNESAGRRYRSFVSSLVRTTIGRPISDGVPMWFHPWDGI